MEKKEKWIPFVEVYGRHEGFHELREGVENSSYPTLPYLRRECRIRVPKGTPFKSLNPALRNKSTVTGRALVVTVRWINPGLTDPYYNRTKNPAVVWVGSGGYWHEADVNDIEILQED